MISESRFNLNIAIVVNSLFPAASLVREVNILSQSQSDLCVIILHLGLIHSMLRAVDQGRFNVRQFKRG